MNAVLISQDIITDKEKKWKLWNKTEMIVQEKRKYRPKEFTKTSQIWQYHVSKSFKFQN